MQADAGSRCRLHPVDNSAPVSNDQARARARAVDALPLTKSACTLCAARKHCNAQCAAGERAAGLALGMLCVRVGDGDDVARRGWPRRRVVGVTGKARNPRPNGALWARWQRDASRRGQIWAISTGAASDKPGDGLASAAVGQGEGDNMRAV